MIASQQPLNLTVNVSGFVPVDVTLQPLPSPATSSVAAPAVIKEDVVRRVNLRDFMFKQVGKFVTIDFVKNDGTDRMLNGRLGVRKHLKGGDSTLADADKPYLVVYDMKAKGYRAVNLETVKEVRAQRTRYTVIG